MAISRHLAVTVSPPSRCSTGYAFSNVSAVTGVATGRQRAELVGLHDGALGQLAAGDAGGEAEVVLDAHAAAGLAAGRRRAPAPRVRSPSEAP